MDKLNKLDVDNTYFTELALIMIKNIIDKNLENKCKSIAIDAPLGYGKSEVAKEIYNYYNSDKTKNTVAIYIDCKKYDFNDTFKNTLDTIFKPVDDYVKARPQCFADSEQITQALKDIMKVIVDCNDKVRVVRESTQKIINSNSLERIENVDLESIDKIVRDIEKIFLEEKKYIFIFDRIDVCYPNYSISILNTIKYILSNLNKFVNFYIFIDFEYLMQIHEGYFSKSINLQYYYTFLFDEIIKMDLNNRNDFFDKKINDTINSYLSYRRELRKVIYKINEYYKLPLRFIEIVIKKMENIVRCNPKYLDNEWIIHTLYSFIVVQTSSIKTFNKILYDNVDLEDDILKKNEIVFYSEFFHELFVSNDPITKNGLMYYDGYTLLNIKKNTSFKTESNSVYLIVDDVEYDCIPQEKFCFSTLLDNKSNFIGIFNCSDLKYIDISYMEKMTFKEYIKYKLNSNY
ncbi:P-loop NTPase fold protein [Faecalibacillus intestinalis]|uniref:P-loop NTPase fold protein n=1 Tax=Faecalibacillus intestinalis TaxID=1982626 RepID=UPI0035211F5C